MVDVSRIAKDLFLHRGWRFAIAASPLFLAAAVVTSRQEEGATGFLLLLAAGHAVYGVVDFRRERRARKRV